MAETIHYIDVAIRIKIDPEREQEMLQVARKLMQESVSVCANDEPDDETMRAMTDEEVAEDVADAQDTISEILQAHPLFMQLGMEIIATETGSEETAASYQAMPSLQLADTARSKPEDFAPGNNNNEDADDGEDGPLDEFNDSGIFLCRWPNGDCSLVAALTKRGAILRLDEFGAAEPEMLHPVEHCMLDPELTTLGGLKLRDIGEQTRDVVFSTCYPALDAFVSSNAALADSDASKEDRQAAQAALRSAVLKEKRRLLGARATKGRAKTELGRNLQQSVNVSSVVADHYADVAADRILEALDTRDKKPN
jgi:hypothetical protein